MTDFIAADQQRLAEGLLAEWRAAERRMVEIPPETAEWHAAQSELEAFRTRYQDLFKAR